MKETNFVIQSEESPKIIQIHRALVTVAAVITFILGVAINELFIQKLPRLLLGVELPLYVIAVYVFGVVSMNFNRMKFFGLIGFWSLFWLGPLLETCNLVNFLP